MNKEQLHRMRKRISDLFYLTFDKLDQIEKAAFILSLEEIDSLIKQSEDF